MLFRQGDILIKKIGSIPSGLANTGGKVVALGESTGHKHEMIYASVMRNVSNPSIQYVEIVDPGDGIVHDEHKEIKLDVGAYQVIRQREYDYNAHFRTMASAFRTVSD